MSVSDYFTDEELESQLRLQYDDTEQWTIDYRLFFNQIEDNGDSLYLKINDREFSIDKITGEVTDLNEEPEADLE